MNKKEAIKLVKQIKSECFPDRDCQTCPFHCDRNTCYRCLLDYVSDNSYNEKFFDFLLVEAEKEEQATLRSVNGLHVSGANVEQLKAVMQESLKKNEPPLNLAHDALIPSSVNAKHDNVNSPKHYCKGGLECIEVIKAQLTPEQNKGYLYGNVLKYMWRWPDKNGLEDLRKAEHYLKWLIEEAEKNEKG